MFDQQPTLELLFEQLGLDANAAAIDQFIETHQLTTDVALHEAPFWSDAQRDFIITHWKRDDEWAIVVDVLNEQLHTEHTSTAPSN